MHDLTRRNASFASGTCGGPARSATTPGRRGRAALRVGRGVADAISTLAIRGAPAIGVAAAYGLALAAARGEDLDTAYELLASSRPTAVNLRWALDEIRDDPTPERARALHERRSSAACAWSGTPPTSRDEGGESRTPARVLALQHGWPDPAGGHGSALGAVQVLLVEHVWVDRYSRARA